MGVVSAARELPTVGGAQGLGRGWMVSRSEDVSPGDGVSNKGLPPNQARKRQAKNAVEFDSSLRHLHNSSIGTAHTYTVYIYIYTYIKRESERYKHYNL